jgi:uncharacterized ferritin-like protein (DUF455 family)
MFWLKSELANNLFILVMQLVFQPEMLPTAVSKLVTPTNILLRSIVVQPPPQGEQVSLQTEQALAVTARHIAIIIPNVINSALFIVYRLSISFNVRLNQ